MDLLALLNNGSSTPKQATSPPTSQSHRPSPSSSTYQSFTTAPSASTSTTSQQSDLDRLFLNAFQNNHPNASQAPTQSGQDGVRRSDPPSSPPPTTQTPTTQQNSLLAMLHSMSSPSPVPPLLAPTPPKAPHQDASSLLLSLMSPQPQPQQQARTPTPIESLVQESAMRPPTPFTSEVPQAVLRAQGSGSQRSSPLSSTSSPAPRKEKERVTIPGGLQTPSSSTLDQTPLVSPNKVSPSVPRQYLASSYLLSQSSSSSIIHHPSPSSQEGIHLPRSLHKLSIDITIPHLSSLSSLPSLIPITLFSSPFSYSPQSKIAIWNNGLVYATKGGKIRTIDRGSGARGLLRGHKEGVREVAIVENGGEGEWRYVASRSEERVVVWKVKDRNESDAGPYEKLLDLSSSTMNRFTTIKLHPRFSEEKKVVAVGTNDGRVFILDLSGEGELVVGEEILETAKEICSVGEPIIDLSFSPDGSALVVLTSSNLLIHRSSAPFEALLPAISLPPSLDPTQATFLSPRAGNPVAIAVGSKQGREVSIVPLTPGIGGGMKMALEFVGGEEEESFGQMGYMRENETVFVGNSLRGSLWAFHLDFGMVSPTFEVEADSISKGAICAEPFIDYVLEIPTPEPILHYHLHHAKEEIVALVLHPQGIHQFSFPYSIPPSPLEDEEIEEAWEEPVIGAGRRMSLEGSIHVESETMVDVAEPDRDEVARGVSVGLEEVKEMTEEEVDVKKEVKEEILPPAPAPPAPAPSAPAPEPATSRSPLPTTTLTKSKKGKKTAASTAAGENGSDKETIANAWANGKKPASIGNGAAAEAMLKELKKLEENLPGKITKVVAKEMEKQAAKWEEDRRNDQVADAARQETMLKLVSSTLTKNTSKLVESNIKDAVANQIVPALSKMVGAALDKSLPDELARLLYRPEITTHLSRNFSTTIAPSLERTILSVISASVVPTISTSIKFAVENIMTTVQQEMVDVRKEIVREQSGALEYTEGEVQALRDDVQGLKASLARVEGALAAMQALQPQSQEYSVPPPLQPQQHAMPEPPQYDRQVPPPVPQQQFSLPPIPREPTPIQQYEETFTNALQPDNEPEFATLLHLINSSPPSRIEAVFPSPPARPSLSAPVVLSLAYRLSQVLGSKIGLLAEEERRQLAWIRRCLSTMDGKDPTTAPYTPRILESVVAGLSLRGKAAYGANDKRGGEELRQVEQYARSRLRLFHQQG